MNELGRRMGYKGNSYVYDIERGAFMPNEDRLRDIARALDVPFNVVKEMALEERLEGLGIKEPRFVSLLKDYPRLTREDRKAIMKTYMEIKKAKQQRDGQDNR